MALCKPDGGVRGIVVGDCFRRLVAKTLAKQYSADFETACSPFQFALSIKAGTECVAHARRVATELNRRRTVVSVDGIGAYDLMRRRAMLTKLSTVPRANAVLPFVRMSYGEPSVYSLVDDEGKEHLIPQGEGGEQGDPLMPAYFSLGQHGALEAVRARLLPTEEIFVLDGVCVLCQPERARAVFDALEEELRNHTGVRCNLGKTKVWNRAGEEPPRVRELQERPEEPVWVGDQALPQELQGLKVLGTPLGTEAFLSLIHI